MMKEDPMHGLVAGLVGLACLAAATPGWAASCREEIREAQRFVDTLRPGPNTRNAQRHLAAARRAGSERRCIAELRQVNVYATRSDAADRRLTAERRPYR